MNGLMPFWRIEMKFAGFRSDTCHVPSGAGSPCISMLGHRACQHGEQGNA